MGLIGGVSSVCGGGKGAVLIVNEVMSVAMIGCIIRKVWSLLGPY